MHKIGAVLIAAGINPNDPSTTHHLDRPVGTAAKLDDAGDDVAGGIGAGDYRITGSTPRWQAP